MVAFRGLLRTGEMFQLHRRDVVLLQGSSQSAMLFLHQRNEISNPVKKRSCQSRLESPACVCCVSDVGLMTNW